MGKNRRLFFSGHIVFMSCILCVFVLSHTHEIHVGIQVLYSFAHFVWPKCKLWTAFAFRAKRKCLFYANNELILKETQHTLSHCVESKHAFTRIAAQIKHDAVFLSQCYWTAHRMANGDQHLMGENCEWNTLQCANEQSALLHMGVCVFVGSPSQLEAFTLLLLIPLKRPKETKKKKS